MVVKLMRVLGKGEFSVKMYEFLLSAPSAHEVCHDANATAYLYNYILNNDKIINYFI